jgi:hypothetical protein
MLCKALGWMDWRRVRRVRRIDWWFSGNTVFRKDRKVVGQTPRRITP